MLTSLIERRLHQDLRAVSFVFALIALVELAAAWIGSATLTAAGLTLYALAALLLVRRSRWSEIRLAKPRHGSALLWGLGLALVWVAGSYAVLESTLGASSANFLFVMARQQTSYGVIDATNAWRYFPVAAAGYCSLSPLCEELFFRGVLLRALERRLARHPANAVQGLLFGAIHLAYLWLVVFDAALIVTMVPLIALAGMIYGWVAQKTGSVFPAMIVHAWCNLLLLLVVYACLIPTVP